MAARSADCLRRCVAPIGRFCRAENGATAVEFAIIGPAFIATLVAVLQVCIVLFAQMAIQNAAVTAGRYFMTGQAQSNGWTASTVVSNGLSVGALQLQQHVYRCAGLLVLCSREYERASHV